MSRERTIADVLADPELRAQAFAEALRRCDPKTRESLESIAEIVRDVRDDEPEKALLRRCGVTANLDDPDEFWTQFQAVGLANFHLTPKELWEGLGPRDFRAMLEQKAAEIERQQAILAAMRAARVPQIEPRGRPVERTSTGHPDRDLLARVLRKIGIEAFLAEHPTLKRTFVLDFKAGGIQGRVSGEKIEAIVAAAKQTSQTLGL